MRLIDADKLKPIITQWNPSALIDESYYHEEQIINAPTEDVIPTKLVEQYAQDLISIGSAQSIFYGEELLKIMNKWRKENA